MNLPFDLINLIITYLVLDVKSICNLSTCNQYFLKICRYNRYWVEYYQSLFSKYHFLKLGPNSVHDGPVTYFKCKVGVYNGWAASHDPLNIVCTNPKHNSNLIQKPVRFKNVFKQCAKRQENKLKIRS